MEWLDFDFQTFADDSNGMTNFAMQDQGSFNFTPHGHQSAFNMGVQIGQQHGDAGSDIGYDSFDAWASGLNLWGDGFDVLSTSVLNAEAEAEAAQMQSFQNSNFAVQTGTGPDHMAFSSTWGDQMQFSGPSIDASLTRDDAFEFNWL